MSKKTFTGGLSSLLGGREAATAPAKSGGRKPGPGRPKSSNRVVTKSSQEGTREGETRATFIVNEEALEKLKAVAYWERVSIKDVVGRAFADYLERTEKKSGKIKPIPQQ